MAEKKKKNKPAKTEKMKMYKTAAGAQQAGTFRQAANAEETMLNDYVELSAAAFKKKYGITKSEAIHRTGAVVHAALGEETKKLSPSTVKLSAKLEKKNVKKAKEAKEKSNMAYGGMAKGFKKGGYANCGASMKATQKSTMACGGMATHKK